MANEQPQRPISQNTTSNQTELDDLALRIYSQRIAIAGVRYDGEREAVESYRNARAFLEARAKVKSGVLNTSKPEGPQLADCYAPNLKPNHPHNLVSYKLGNLERVNRIAKFLADNPTPEGNPDELVGKVNREFPDLGWDLPTINVARAVFPAYAK